MEKIAAFIKDELSGWKPWEILWITTATITICRFPYISTKA